MTARFIILVSFICLSQCAIACRYKDVGIDENIKRAQVIFIAQTETASNDRSGQGPDVPSMMRVTQVIKGNVNAGQVVGVYTSNSSCGLGFQKGQQWLILASGEPLRTDLPSGSLLMQDHATRELISKRLGLKLN